MPSDRRVGPVLTVAVLLALIGSSGRGGDGSGFAAGNTTAVKFRLQQPKANGQLDWELLAQAGVAQADSLTLTGVQFVLYRDDGDNLELRTPECTFDRLKKQGRGDQRVNIRSRNLTITGVGFDFDTARKTLVIRSRVHVTVQRRGIDPLAGLAPPGATGKPAK